MFENINKIGEQLTKKVEEGYSECYKLGQASVMAVILKSLHGGDKYNIKDIGAYVETFMNSDKQIKDYVYECMKDLD